MANRRTFEQFKRDNDAFRHPREIDLHITEPSLCAQSTFVALDKLWIKLPVLSRLDIFEDLVRTDRFVANDTHFRDQIRHADCHGWRGPGDDGRRKRRRDRRWTLHAFLPDDAPPSKEAEIGCYGQNAYRIKGEFHTIEPNQPIRREDGKSLLELWQDRRRLSRVVMDLAPQPHWGLGLPCYTFATSPIRRYLDLVSHRQLLAAASGLPPVYDREALEQIVTYIEPAMRRAGLLKSRRLRYWLLKYLAARVGQTREALVLESLPHRYRLMLPEILLEFFMQAPASRKLTPGDTILVRLDKVSPREDQIKVSLA